jgi:hypothetical protein
VVVVSGNAGRKSGGWVSAFEAASVALFDLLVSSSNPGAASQIARQQDEHAPEGDEGKEEVVVHGSIPHDVGVDQQHADDQHEASGNGGGGGKFNEGHGGSLLVVRLREQEKDAVSGQAEADEAQDEDEEGHGGSVRVVVEQNVDDHKQQDGNADEGNEDHKEVHVLRLHLVRLEQLGRHAALLSHERGDDTITDPGRENVRPFVYRLVGNAERLGSGGSGASEVFNGF